jgi:hypothetical protein
METPFIRQFIFPEGTFDFVNCEIAMFQEDDNGQREITSTFHSFIAIGMPGIDMSGDTSKELKYFDESKVFAYAQDLNEFKVWIEEGGWDFIILDYEKELIFDES